MASESKKWFMCSCVLLIMILCVTRECKGTSVGIQMEERGGGGSGEEPIAKERRIGETGRGVMSQSSDRSASRESSDDTRRAEERELSSDGMEEGGSSGGGEEDVMGGREERELSSDGMEEGGSSGGGEEGMEEGGSSGGGEEGMEEGGSSGGGGEGVMGGRGERDWNGERMEGESEKRRDGTEEDGKRKAIEEEEGDERGQSVYSVVNGLSRSLQLGKLPIYSESAEGRRQRNDFNESRELSNESPKDKNIVLNNATENLRKSPKTIQKICYDSELNPKGISKKPLGRIESDELELGHVSKETHRSSAKKEGNREAAINNSGKMGFNIWLEYTKTPTRRDFFLNPSETEETKLHMSETEMNENKEMNESEEMNGSLAVKGKEENDKLIKDELNAKMRSRDGVSWREDFFSRINSPRRLDEMFELLQDVTTQGCIGLLCQSPALSPNHLNKGRGNDGQIICTPAVLGAKDLDIGSIEKKMTAGRERLEGRDSASREMPSKIATKYPQDGRSGQFAPSAALGEELRATSFKGIEMTREYDILVKETQALPKTRVFLCGVLSSDESVVGGSSRIGGSTPPIKWRRSNSPDDHGRLSTGTGSQEIIQGGTAAGVNDLDGLEAIGGFKVEKDDNEYYSHRSNNKYQNILARDAKENRLKEFKLHPAAPLKAHSTISEGEAHGTPVAIGIDVPAPSGRRPAVSFPVGKGEALKEDLRSSQGVKGPRRMLMSLPVEESERTAKENPMTLSEDSGDSRSASSRILVVKGVLKDAEEDEFVDWDSENSLEKPIVTLIGSQRASRSESPQGVKFVPREGKRGGVLYVVTGSGTTVRRWRGEYHRGYLSKREADSQSSNKRGQVGRGDISYHRENGGMLGISMNDELSGSAEKPTKLSSSKNTAASHHKGNSSPRDDEQRSSKDSHAAQSDQIQSAGYLVSQLVTESSSITESEVIRFGQNSMVPKYKEVKKTVASDLSYETPKELYSNPEANGMLFENEIPENSTIKASSTVKTDRYAGNGSYKAIDGLQNTSLPIAEIFPSDRRRTSTNFTTAVVGNFRMESGAKDVQSRVTAVANDSMKKLRKTRTLVSSFGRGRGGGRGGAGLMVPHSLEDDEKGILTVGMILPHVAFGQREYTRAINAAVTGLQRSRGRKLEFFKKHIFSQAQVRSTTMKLTPSPTAILNSLCKEFLSVNVSAILYLMNYEKYGRSTASAQYFLQLAGYLGIPVIAWNADNSGLERRASQASLQLQLAPSLEHQTAAMLSILERYKWHQFSIVTSQIAGHDDFVQAVRERILDMQDVFKFTILNAVLVTKPSDLSELVNSESRVVLLYCTRDEALRILAAAADYKITGENYVWVAAQSVIENRQPLPQFPVGMLGVHFDTSMASLVNEIATAVKVYAYGVEDFVNDPRNEKLSLNTQLSCEGAGDSRWKVGDRFFKYLRNVSVEGDHGKPNIEFTADGVLKAAELKIMNLRPGVSKQLVWEEIGVWKSWEREGLDIKDIVWPGGSHTPPQGVPEKFHMRITFLEEPPYINVAPPDPITGKCSINRGVLCRFAAETDMSGLDVTQAHRNASYYQCCSGFCIDLLEKFSEELGFTYELVRVEDGKWGTLDNGKWNGLIADLINRKTDMVMTSLMINSDREAVVDFTVPFMESGIAIVVAKRTGIISPTAFLEPFDTASWMLVGFVAIQASAFTIFLFEWLSPSGFNMKVAPSTNHRFSLFRTYWLVWAVLFQAAVHVDCPKGFTARFMTNVWAMFAVVFLAIYTANLAAFMITREEFHEFSGIDDHRLAKPFSHKPMFKFGTIPWGHTDSTLKKYFKEMHAYMKRHNRSVVSDGIEAVLSGDLDAFVYDGTVLDYLVSQDEDCRLLTVGSWYAMTGYGLAFQRNSKYVRMFNQRLLDFRENGDLERLRRYWMTGSCKPGKQERKSSDPLALEQFLSAFLLLMSGILLAAVLLLLEHLYFKYVRHHLARTDRGGCCALVSLSMGKSLTFRGAVYEATDMYKNNPYRGRTQPQHPGSHRAFTGGGRHCGCSYCEGLHNLWATRRELEDCRLRIRHLEKQMEAHGIRPLPPPPPSLLPGSSPGNRRYLNDEDALRTRDMTRNHVTSTEYCGQLYRPCRTEIAEMETVL